MSIPKYIPQTVDEYRKWWKEHTLAPYGYCFCLCGGKTTLASGTDRPSFQFKGEPRRFINGHAMRGTDGSYGGPGPNRNGGYCECGCGQHTKLARASNKSNGNVNGKPVRYVAGHHATGPRGKNKPRGEYPSTVDEYRQWWSEQCPNVPYGECWCGCGQETNLSSTRDVRQGRFADEPVRYIRGHGFTKPESDNDYKLEDCGYGSACWIWQGNVDAYEGYGVIRERSTHKRLLAHRVYFERHGGLIPNGHHLHHDCEQRACVNPEHVHPLSPGDHSAEHAIIRRTKKQ